MTITLDRWLSYIQKRATLDGGIATRRKIAMLAVQNWDFTTCDQSALTDRMREGYSRDIGSVSSFADGIIRSTAEQVVAWYRRNKTNGRKVLWELSEVAKTIKEGRGEL